MINYSFHEGRREKLLSPQEVAEELAVTKRTVYNWLRSGKLHGKKFGGVWRVHAREVAILPESSDEPSSALSEVEVGPAAVPPADTGQDADAVNAASETRDMNANGNLNESSDTGPQELLSIS